MAKGAWSVEYPPNRTAFGGLQRWIVGVVKTTWRWFRVVHVLTVLDIPRTADPDPAVGESVMAFGSPEGFRGRLPSA
jgi:hypothetical protein